MKNIFLLLVIVFGVFFLSYLIVLIRDKKVQQTWFNVVVFVLIFLWITLVCCINENFKELHDEESNYSEVNIAISLLGYYLLTLLFDAPNLFSDLRGKKLSQNGKVIKYSMQLGIVSFAPAFYFWQHGTDYTLEYFFLKFVSIMCIGGAFIGTIAWLVHKPNIIRDFLFKKYEIDDYIKDLRKKLSIEGIETVNLINKNGFVSESDISQNSALSKGIEELISYGIPIIKYSINSSNIIYTYGEERDMDESLYETPVSNPQKVRIDSIKYIVSSRMISDISQKTGAKKSVVGSNLRKLLQAKRQ